MKIRFDYHGTRRSGELVAYYTADNGNLIAKVREDGVEVVKNFLASKMSKVESGARLTDAELMPALVVAAGTVARRVPKFDGNPLQLLLAIVYNQVGHTEAEQALPWVDDATRAYMIGASK